MERKIEIGIVPLGFLGTVGVAWVAEVYLEIGLSVLAGFTAALLVAIWRVPADEPPRRTAIRKWLHLRLSVGALGLAAAAEAYEPSMGIAFLGGFCATTLAGVDITDRPKARRT